MMRSQVQGENKDSSSRVSMTRTSKTGWLQDSFHPVIARLTKRVSHISGLKTDTFNDESELLQVSLTSTVLARVDPNLIIKIIKKHVYKSRKM